MSIVYKPCSKRFTITYHEVTNTHTYMCVDNITSFIAFNTLLNHTPIANTYKYMYVHYKENEVSKQKIQTRLWCIIV